MLHRIAEQDTTDFDKALRHIAAPFVLAVGFAGGRVDHTLGVFNTLVQRAEVPCFVLSPRDVVFVAPEEMELRLKPGTRLSLFPMGEVAGDSEGLRWPIGGVGFAPDGAVGVSNEVVAPLVRLRFSARRMLVILPRAALLPALESRVPGFARSDAHGG